MVATELEQALRKAIRGEVRFDAQAKALYATDASNYRQIPIGVVVPKSKEDIIQTVSLCRQFGAPILSRGAGTSLAGQCCNVAVVMDMSKYYNRILKIDAAARNARVQPGIVLDHLRHEAEKQGLTFGPDPATHSRCTLGGMIGNNSCGVHALMAGKTVDNVESLEILTYDGQRMEIGRTSDEELTRILREESRRAKIYGTLKNLRDRYADLIRQRYPKIPRRVSGYNLDELLPENGFHVARALVGTEGTCVIVLEATLKLVPNPASRSLLVLGYPDVYAAADETPAILEHRPIGLEGFDVDMVNGLRRYQGYPARISRLPPGEAWLLVEFGGESKADSDGKAHALMSQLRSRPGAPAAKLLETAHEVEDVWTVRESALAATAFIPGARDRAEGWEDSAVPPAKLGSYLRDLRTLYNRYGYHGAFYGHFGDGCVHTRIDFDFDSAEGLKAFRAFLDDAADLVIRYGGSISGEHGDGQARSELLPKMFGPELIGAFREFKAAWDPQGKMNPGKIVDPLPILGDLRYGAAYRPAEVKTHFQFPEDQGRFGRAALRCVGVGKCRREEGGTMCPSYMATRDEKDSTRGRAHLLFEMMQGEIVKDLWRSEEVKDALDLCLACKGCKSDCPTNVDMATYKAEFLSHYYEKRLRPLHAYAFGWVSWWARAASRMPGVANFFTQTPGLSRIAKRLAGMPPQRRIPAFAAQTFQRGFAKRAVSNKGKPQVILWTDTFNNHFYPEAAHAAVDVLEAAGYQVLVPGASLCCGRPLYDYGMLNLAKKMLKQVLQTLQLQIERGIPLIVLEPSCAAVFRDEMLNLFPNDPLAQKLSRQTHLLSEFLTSGSDPLSTIGVRPLWIRGLTPMARKAIVQGHCHHRAVFGFDAEEKLLKMLGIEVQTPEPGCCGMAGSFGFEKDHYDVSAQIGEHALLPAVRQAASDTLIIADGFSCREQILQGTGRRAYHVAEVLRMWLEQRD